MDIPRAKKPNRRRYIYAAAALAAVVLTTLGLRSLKPAAPSVDRATAWIDSVQRGRLVLQVRGPGTLVPEQIRWISAVTAGRVERRLAEPGQQVTPETVLLELTNPDVQLQELESSRQLSAVRAGRVSLDVTLKTDLLNQEATVATALADYNEAKRQAEIAQGLSQKNLISAADLSRANDEVKEQETRYQLEQERLKVIKASVDSQLALQDEQVQRLRAVYDFQRDRVRSMVVKAGANGVLQELSLEVGQWAQPGATLARVVEPGRLKAVLRIPETQAKDIVLGQPATIDTRNGVIEGKVARIDPAVQNGTVTVDVSLVGELPRGARPDLTVDGTIEIERLDDVMYVGRPAYGQANSTVGLFKLTPDGAFAERVNVRLGRSSVNQVEVVSGLQPGDKVIISDMSRWDSFDRVKLQ